MKTIDKFLRIWSVKWAEETQEKYSRCLHDFAHWLDDEEPTEYAIIEWMDSHDWGASSRNVALCALRTFFKWRVGEDQSPAHKVPFPRRVISPQRTLSDDQVKAILSSIDTSTAKGVRDITLILLMLDTGLRSSEVCRLKTHNVDLRARRFIALVKGGRWDEGVFSHYTAVNIDAWIPLRNKFAKPRVDTLFVSVGGNTPGKPLTRYGLTVIFRYIGKRAGVYPFSPHDLRRTFAVISLRAGAPTRLLQIAGRWRDLRQVERYTQKLDASHFEPYFPSNYIMGIDYEEDPSL